MQPFLNLYFTMLIPRPCIYFDLSLWLEFINFCIYLFTVCMFFPSRFAVYYLFLGVFLLGGQKSSREEIQKCNNKLWGNK